MQELSFQQIAEAIEASVEKQIPLNVAYNDGQWHNLHSRFLALRDEHILVAVPIDHQDEAHDFAPAAKLALNFKLKHHKYVTSARVVGTGTLRQDDGTVCQVLSLCYPTHMHRLQRRSFARVEVPEGRIVRVSLWQGGQDAETTTLSDLAVYSGVVLDFSAGGFRAEIDADQFPKMEVGQTVGVRIAFGAGEKSVYADAQFRHRDEPKDGKVALGFQFVGLAQTAEGRDTMRAISIKMHEFTHSERRYHRSGA